MFAGLLLMLILVASFEADGSRTSARAFASKLMNDAIMRIAQGQESIFVHFIIEDYNNFVMLSNYLTAGEASFNAFTSSISLSFAKQELKIDYLHEKYRGVRSLTLTHCAMKSLKGIEQFEQLEELNVRGNNLQEVSELYRIASKELIVRLEFAGNDIEYLGQGLFINLVQVFPNLVELNGKNYHSIIHRNHSGALQMKKIMAKSYQIQKSMQATLRKTDRSTKRHKQSQATSHCPPTVHDDSQNHQTSRNKQPKELQHTSKKRSCIQYSPQSQADCKENLDNSNHPLEYDVSLGDISNIHIPMTKSVRGSYVSNQGNSHLKNPKKKGLEIFTLNESLHGKQPLSQPTATFAMQRDRQTQQNGGLMFRNREKARYDMHTVPIEQYESKEEYERPTKRQTYQSQPDELNHSLNSSLAGGNLMHQEKTINEGMREQLTIDWYQKNLRDRCFRAWKRIPCHRNFPVKRSFL